MPVRSATAIWEGNLREGKGSMKLGSGAFEGEFSHATRFGDTPGTNPEELIGAAHAGCFSMFLSALLSKAGHVPTSINTSAKVHLGDGPKITLIELTTEAEVPGIDEQSFLQHAEEAKEGCPVSQALAATEIKLVAKLR